TDRADSLQLGFLGKARSWRFFCCFFADAFHLARSACRQFLPVVSRNHWQTCNLKKTPPTVRGELHMSIQTSSGPIAVFSLAASAFLATGAPPGLAQDDAELEEITVTGSRLQRADITATSPIDVTGQSEIQASNTVNLEDFLRERP